MSAQRKVNPFRLTQELYNEQRHAFIRDYLQENSQKLALPPRKLPLDSHPEIESESLFELMPLDVPTSYKSFAAKNKGKLIIRRLNRLKTFKEAPEEYYNRVDTVLNTCKAVERLPNIKKQILQEKSLLKRYSNHMDWTLNTLQANAGLEQRILRPLFRYLAEERLVTEETAKEVARELRTGRLSLHSKRASL